MALYSASDLLTGALVRVYLKQFGPTRNITYITCRYMGKSTSTTSTVLGSQGLLTPSDDTLPLAFGPMVYGTPSTTIYGSYSYNGCPADLYCKALFEQFMHPGAFGTFTYNYTRAMAANVSYEEETIAAPRSVTVLSTKSLCPVTIMPYIYWNGSYFSSYKTAVGGKLGRPDYSDIFETWLRGSSASSGVISHYMNFSSDGTTYTNTKATSTNYYLYQPVFNVNSQAKFTARDSGYIVDPFVPKILYQYNGSTWVNLNKYYYSAY